MEIYIYGLYNSFSDEIRYIGKTNNVGRRLKEHLREAKSGKYAHLPKNRWILKTINSGGKILCKIIETTNEIEWETKEIYWISYYKQTYGNLTNISRGGETSCSKNFLSYNECKVWVKNNIDTKTVNSQSSWKNYAKLGNLPDFIPHNPWVTYSNENFDWNDFLNKNDRNYTILKRDYMTFEELCSFIKQHNIKTYKELQDIVKSENILTIPRNTVVYYKRRGYNIMRMFTKYFTFDEFVQYIKNNFPRLTSENEYYRCHKNMDKRAPFYYKIVYFNHEKIDDFIFTNKLLTYNECKFIINSNGIKSKKEYLEFRKNNMNNGLPSHPDICYKNYGWNGWENFLNVISKKTRKDCDYSLFIRYMRIYHPYVKKSTQYIKMMKEEKISRRIPFRPDVKYKMQWNELFK